MQHQRRPHDGGRLRAQDTSPQCDRHNPIAGRFLNLLQLKATLGADIQGHFLDAVPVGQGLAYRCLCRPLPGDERPAMPQPFGGGVLKRHGRQQARQQPPPRLLGRLLDDALPALEALRLDIIRVAQQ